MSGINGVQLARLWAKAWKDANFKSILERDPIEAIVQFRKEFQDFPDPTTTNLLDLDEYGQPGVDFKKMHKDTLKDIIEEKKSLWWTRGKFFSPAALQEALKNGELEIE